MINLTRDHKYSFPSIKLAATKRHNNVPNAGKNMEKRVTDTLLVRVNWLATGNKSFGPEISLNTSIIDARKISQSIFVQYWLW